MSSYGNDAYLMLLNPDTPIKSVDDIRAGAPGKITLGANNAASSNLIFGVIAKEALNLNVNVVRGYTGAAPMFLAMQRKEIDGQFVGISLGEDRPARDVGEARVQGAGACSAAPAAIRTFPTCRPGAS